MRLYSCSDGIGSCEYSLFRWVCWNRKSAASISRIAVERAVASKSAAAELLFLSPLGLGLGLGFAMPVLLLTVVLLDTPPPNILWLVAANVCS